MDEPINGRDKDATNQCGQSPYAAADEEGGPTKASGEVLRIRQDCEGKGQVHDDGDNSTNEDPKDSESRPNICGHRMEQ